MKKQNLIAFIDIILIVLVLSFILSTALTGEYLILLVTSIALTGAGLIYIKSRKNYQLYK